MHDGNVRRRIDELNGAGNANLAWQRYHNSIPRGVADFAHKTFGTAGSWRNNWQYDLIEETDPKTGRATFELIYPSGTRRVLYLTKSKLLSAPKGLPERGRLMNGGVQVTLDDNSRVFFRVRPQANRKPRYEAVHLTKPSGQVYTFSRDSRGRLVQIKDKDGAWIRIGYKTVPLQTNPLVRVGEVVRAPARGQWLEIPVALTSVSARVLSVRLQVPAQAQVAEVEFYAVGSSTPLTGTVYRGLGAAAFDRNATTAFKNTNNQDSVMVRFDLPLASNVRLGKVRLLSVAGMELQLIGTQVKVGLVQPPKRSLAVISNVKTSNGLTLSYEYEKLPWTGGEEQLALVRARYGDGAVANYRYSGREAKLGTRPLLVQADDPRYSGRAKQIAYEYQVPLVDKVKAGFIKAEKHPVTGAAWARLEIPANDPHKRVVHYSDDRAIVYRVLADGSGRLAERTDSLGRKTTYKYTKRDQGHAFFVRNHLGHVATYTFNERGRATAVKHSNEPKRKQPAGMAARAASATTTPAVARSNTTWKKDHTGRKIEVRRDARGQVDRVRFADGTENTFTYDAKGRVVQSSQKGLVFTFGYDVAGRRTSRTDSLGNVTRFGYDSHGNLAQTTDPLGRTTRHERDEQGRLLKTTYPDGRQHTIVRDAYGRTIAETDVQGRKAEYAYDILGRKTRETDYAGRTTSYSYSELPMSCGSCTLSDRPTRIVHADGAVTDLLYDSEGRLLARTEAAGTPFAATTTSSYDNEGRVLAMTLANNSTTRNSYDKKGRLVATTDPLGRKATFTYNAKGQRLSVTDALGRTTRWSFDGRGNPSEIVAPAGGVTKNSYDGNNRLAQRTDPAGASTRYQYDAGGNLVRQTDARGGITTHAYDAVNRRTETRYTDGKRETWAYDTASRLILHVTPDDRAVTYAYDASNRLLWERDSLGRTTSFSYAQSPARVARTDPLGRVTTTTYTSSDEVAEILLPDGSKTSITYDAAGRILVSTDAAGSATRYAYTAAGDLAFLTDAKGNTYRFTYDLLRRRTATIYPDGSQEKWTYDAAGQVTAYVTRAGQTKTTTYNAAGQRLTETWSPAGVAPNVAYAYDRAGRLIMADNGLAKLTYAYDELNRVASETTDLSALMPDLAAQTVRYGYDELGRRGSLSYPDRTKVSYGYDARDRLTTVSDGPGRALASYDFDAAGGIEKITRDNGVVTRYGYDVAGQLTEIRHDNGGKVLASSRYALDSRGRRTAQTREDGITESYTYDLASRLVGADYGTTPAHRESFSYDAVGNRVSATLATGNSQSSTTAYTANALNQYTQMRTGGVTTTLVHDANGNLVNDGRQHYCYDAQNRLVAVEPAAAPAPGTTKAEFYYDARNRCVLRSYATADAQGRWQPNVAESRALTYDTTWNLLAERCLDGLQAGEYVHGLRTDEILSVKTGGADAVNTPLTDGLGNTIALANDKGKLIERCSFDVFGMPESVPQSGGSNPASQSGYRFLFTGREWLGSVGLNDHRNRYYRPQLGRWISLDPIGLKGGTNLLAYANNSPAMLSDPLGLLDPVTTVAVGSAFVTQVTTASVGTSVVIGGSLGSGVLVSSGAAAVVFVSGYGYWQLGTLAGEYIVSKMSDNDDYPSCDFEYMVGIPGDPCHVRCFYMCYTPTGRFLTQGPNGAAKEGCGARITNPWRPPQ